MVDKWRTKSEMQSHLGRRIYGGQSKAAKHIMPLLPRGGAIVEPFAGHAHVSVMALKQGKFEKAVLGDANCGALDWVRKNRKTDNMFIKCQDWRKTVKENDSKDAVFVFDPPWKAEDKCYTAYKGNCTNFAPDIIKAAKTMKGKAVLLVGDTKEHRDLVCSKDSPFKCSTITVDSKIFGNASKWKEIVAVKK